MNMTRILADEVGDRAVSLNLSCEHFAMHGSAELSIGWCQWPCTCADASQVQM